MSGNRGPKMSVDIKRMIRDAALKAPYVKRTKLAEDLCKQIEADGKPVPTVETLEKLISKIRNERDELDSFWSTVSLALYPITPEALPVVLEVWARSQEQKVKVFDLDLERERLEKGVSDPDYAWKVPNEDNRHFLTIREALWVSRLYCVVTEERFKKQRPKASHIDYLDLLRSYAFSFAIKEKVLSMEPNYPKKREDILSFWLEDIHLYGELAVSPPSVDDIMTRLTKQILETQNERPHRKEG